ncbi:MAG: hypothetical protein ACOYYS_14965 [Chloroflexota bacterium]
MNTFSGILRYEYGMLIRRWGLWFAYGLTYAFYSASFFASPPGNVEAQVIISQDEIWFSAGMMIFMINMFMPLMGGILAADRMQRDVKLGLRELQRSTPLHHWTYILGKYCGVLLGVLTPAFVYVIFTGAVAALAGMAPWSFVGALVLAFLAMAVPAYAFVVAFSLACPLIMPVRVYQILFVGYWFWGNYLNPDYIPTLAGTALTPNGEFAWLAFFSGTFSGGVRQPTATELAAAPFNLALNWSVLALSILGVMVALDLYHRRQVRQA